MNFIENGYTRNEVKKGGTYMLKICDLKLLKDIGVLYENDIVLYGAGNYGRKAAQLLRNMGISILGFGDSNTLKWGESIDEYKILTIDEMKELLNRENIIVIITMENPDGVEEVLKVLERFGIAEVDCYTYFALKNTIELHIEDGRIPEAFRTEEKIKAKIYNEVCKVSWGELQPLYALWSILSGKNDILILQPGKVGSTAIVDSLHRVGIPCWHVHSLSGKFMSPVFDRHHEGFSLLKEAEKIRIISLVRDPIARGIAMYFQAFMEYIVSIADFYKPDLLEGVCTFLKGETENGKRGAMFDWFDVEIKDIFGIDMYQYGFDRENGYRIIQQENIELLLIKMEKLSECQDIIGQFVGAKDFKLVKANVAHDKLYRFAYEELKRTIDIPQSVLDFYYKNNPAMDLFYTPKEKNEFYRKWLYKK